MRKVVYDIVEIKDSTNGQFKFNVVQRMRDVYYEDTLHNKKGRDAHVCATETLEVAEKLVKIFTDNPFTAEWLEKHRGWFKPLERKNTERSFTKYKIYQQTNSLVKSEYDLHNFTDQSVRLMQLMKDSKGNYSERSKRKVICRYVSTDYVEEVLNDWSKQTGELFFN